MSPLLSFGDGRAFATGATRYFIGKTGDIAPGRMLLQVRLENQATVAAVDTGGHYFVCNPDLGELLEQSLVDPLEDVQLQIRGHLYHGMLYRLTVEIEASHGESILIPATVFLPDANQEWSMPSFMGLEGVLDRIRFAVDPEESLFYFGPLGDGVG